MKKLTFPFLKCCEWLYLSALSAGLLFTAYGFLQTELARVIAFADIKSLTVVIAAGAFCAGLIVYLAGEKRFQLWALLGVVAVNITAGVIYMRQSETPSFFYSYLALEAVCFAGAVFVYLVRHSPVFKGALVLVQAGGLVALAILKKPLDAWCVCIMLAAFLLYLAELTAEGKKESLGLLPIFALAMLLLCLLPKSEKPLDWSFVKKAYTAVQEQAEMLMVDIAYMIEGENSAPVLFTGYGGGAGQGGRVFDQDGEQLKVTANTKNPLYLTGSVYSVYTEKGWQASPQSKGQADFENNSVAYALNQSLYADMSDSLTSSSLITVEYRLIKTRDFFHELNTTNLYFGGKTPEFKNKDPWKMKKAMGKDFKYQLRFLEINENSDEIKELMRGKAWKQNALRAYSQQESEAEIYKACTALPDTVPQRVYDLARSIASSADNDYDKMQAFKSYLADYTYTKAPPPCPEGGELTDWFLFESKQGYCTYFATAMAVLGRCEGIPTRYAEGFMTHDTCKGVPAEVTLTGEYSHAWAEFYIKNIGWVRIDATPGYGDVRPPADRWKPAENNGTAQTEKPDLNDEKPSGEEPQKPEKQGKSAKWYLLALVQVTGAVLAAALLTAVIAVCLKSLLRRKRYARADVQEKVKTHIKLLLKLGKLRGVPIAEGETLGAYSLRAGDALNTNEYTLAKACNLYEGIRFGGKTPTPRELCDLEAYTQKAECSYLAACGFVKKLIYRII